MKIFSKIAALFTPKENPVAVQSTPPKDKTPPSTWPFPIKDEVTITLKSDTKDVYKRPKPIQTKAKPKSNKKKWNPGQKKSTPKK